MQRYETKLIANILQYIYGRDVEASDWASRVRIQFLITAPDGSLQLGIRAADIYTEDKKSAASCLDDAERAGLHAHSERISLAGKEKISHRVRVSVA